jgi:hypothetical protein
LWEFSDFSWKGGGSVPITSSNDVMDEGCRDGRGGRGGGRCVREWEWEQDRGGRQHIDDGGVGAIVLRGAGLRQVERRHGRMGLGAGWQCVPTSAKFKNKHRQEGGRISRCMRINQCPPICGCMKRAGRGGSGGSSWPF